MYSIYLMALIKVNTDKSGASALELTAHYKMTIYWGWQSVKPLQSPIIYTQVTIQSLTL